MVSIGPYTQAYDMKQMYNFVDWNNNKDKKVVCTPSNSLMGVLRSNPDFSIFAGIVKRARYEGKLSQDQANFTLFVPSNVQLLARYNKVWLDNIDDGLCRQIMAFSMMNRKLDKDIIQSSPISTLPTIDRSNSMLVQTVSNVTHLPNSTTVIDWNYSTDNGIIHIVDNLLILDYFL
jgi:uncharacterized surface protein with fasciclin (FAS1) repeats